MSIEPQRQGCFGRMFPEADRPLTGQDEEKLCELGEAMCVEGPGAAESTNLNAGYTYFGQFIAHDLIWNRTLLDAPPPEHQFGPNFRTPRFDLDHLYGGGPERRPTLYEKNAERFRIGTTEKNLQLNLPGGTPRDLPFDGDQVQIGDGVDFRNAENLIIRQLHVLFLKFHNQAIEQLKSGQIAGDLPDRDDRRIFEQARTLVTWSYQWLLWNDFLVQIVDPQSWHPVRTLPAGAQSGAYDVPVEFSLAAFRFGHSLVRDLYPLNKHQPLALLQDLINPREGSAKHLRDNDLVEWSRFFRGLKRKGGVTFARAINAQIVDPLHNLPPEIVQLFTAGPHLPKMTSLPARTLLRGARAHLASGQQVAAALKVKKITTAEFAADNSKPGRALRAAKLTENTPLWYYILKEADLHWHGSRLGRVGSQIVLDVFETALQRDPDSYLTRKGANWQPPTWFSLRPETRTNVTSIARLIRLVGDDQFPDGSN
jgi:hypothetical protein